MNKAYKLIYNIALDATESDEVEQDDLSEDGDFDALLMAIQSNSININVDLNIESQKQFISKHYSIPDGPPPDFI